MPKRVSVASAMLRMSPGGSLVNGEAEPADDSSLEGEEEEAKSRGGFCGALAGAARSCLYPWDSMDRLMYRAERSMSKRGRTIQCILLSVLGLCVIAVSGLAYSCVWRYDEETDPRNEEDIFPIFEGMWEAWTFMADGGTHAKNFLPEQRVVSALITMAGIIYLAIVLAVVVDMVREKMDSLKRGRTKVYEQNHTLVVNWTERTIPLIYELCLANASAGGGVVVVLAEERIDVMEFELALHLPASQRLGTTVVCRSGSPVNVAELVKVSAEKARAVIILASSGDADQADSSSLRSVLSLRSLGAPLKGYIVVEMRDIDNQPLLDLVGGSVVESLVSHDVIGRLMLMSVRMSGLAKVYESVLGFEGHEFHMREWPELVGLSFGELPERFPRAIPLGIKRVLDEDGVELNPHAERVIRESEQLIVIAEDEYSYKPEHPTEVDMGHFPAQAAVNSMSEKILICGWRRDIRDVLLYLDCMMANGSEVHMMTHCVPLQSRTQQLLDEGLDVTVLENIVLVHHEGNSSVRRRLEQLPIESYTSCVIFADKAFETDPMHADSHSLATLLLIRDIQNSRLEWTGCKADGGRPTPIICEILDSGTQRTITGHRSLSMSSDFVQSNKLIAQILAMVAQQREVKVILDELLGHGGCSMLVQPSRRYVGAEEAVSFWTVAKRVADNNGILIGYQLRGSSAKTILNPSDKHVEQNWDAYDFAVIGGNRAFRLNMSAELAFMRAPRLSRAGSLFSNKSGCKSPTSSDEHSTSEEPEEKPVPAALMQAVPAQLPQQQRQQRQQQQQQAPSDLEMLYELCSAMPDDELKRFGRGLELFGRAAATGQLRLNKAGTTFCLSGGSAVADVTVGPPRSI